MKKILLRGLVATILSLGFGAVQAHVVTQLFVELDNEEQGWRMEILFDAGISLPEMRNDPFSPAPFRDWLTELDEAAHGRLRTEAVRYLREWVSLLVNGEEVVWEASFPDWDSTPPDFPELRNEGAYFRIVIAQDWPEGGGTLSCALKEGDHPKIAIEVAANRFLTIAPGQTQVIAERTRESKEDAEAPPDQRSGARWLVLTIILLVASGAAVRHFAKRAGGS